jgi:hypothetical protein
MIVSSDLKKNLYVDNYIGKFDPSVVRFLIDLLAVI